MTKFIIIDNSIENTVGHHFQYAAHCLIAAKKQGLLPVLAANRSFQPSNDDPWQTLSIYHHGFWGAKRKRQRKMLDLDRSISTRINFLKHSALFSRIGLTLESRSVLFGQIKLPGIEESVYTTHPRSWLIISSIVVPFYLISAKLSRLLNNFKRRVYLVATGSKKIDPITGVNIDKETSHAFAQDTARLFKKIKLEGDDIILIPTVGINELLGLVECLHNFPDAKKTRINLLFRRNIYSGRLHNYWKQDEELRFLRSLFTNFVQGLGDYKVFFFTDSDELTMQYNRLGTSVFHTLPLPHTVSPVVHELEQDQRLCITYIGDARTEKGYHHLPQAIQDLWDKIEGMKKVKFAIQSNYNIPSGEPKIVVARSQLETLQNDNNDTISVQLIYEPLSFDEYIRFLLESDIVLLPYDEMQYYARSSGILVECLAAGIPVIVPSGTWMSRQFTEETYKHYERLRQAMIVEKSYTGEEISWKQSGSNLEPYKNRELVFGGETARAYCILVKPYRSLLLYVRLRINASYLTAVKADVAQLHYDETIVKFSSLGIERLKSEKSSFVLRLNENCKRIWLGFKNAYDNSAIYVTDIEIAFLSGDEVASNFPSGAVGLTYDNPDQISSLLSEMIEHYSHYRKTALEFSKDYSKIHNANNLVQKVLEVSNRLEYET